MKDNSQHVTHHVNPVSAGLAGFVVGAVGTALAMTFASEEKRKQLQMKFVQFREYLNKTMDHWEDEAHELQQNAKVKSTDELINEADKELKDMEKDRND